MVGKEMALEILTEEIEDYIPKEKQHEYENAVDRVIYEFKKTGKIKPKCHKGKRIHDYYTCGNCGFTISEINFNFCPNCGFGIKWDPCRCLTK